MTYPPHYLDELPLLIRLQQEGLPLPNQPFHSCDHARCTEIINHLCQVNQSLQDRIHDQAH